MISGDYAVVILAAGGSSRMGSPKQLLPFAGKPLVRHAVETALQTNCRGVVVVLGANAGEIRPVLEGLETRGKFLTITENPRWAEGMGSSIHAGLEALSAQQVQGLILTLSDMPLVTAAILQRLASEHDRTGQPIVSSSYAGTVGVPVFFAASHFSQLQELAPQQGCKGVILKNGEAVLRIPCPEAEADIDTPQDYARLQDSSFVK